MSVGLLFCGVYIMCMQKNVTNLLGIIFIRGQNIMMILEGMFFFFLQQQQTHIWRIYIGSALSDE